ncbi:hypothetical protein VNO77_19484 [Canavalia gladiata]|uniref:Uncharacterized protein n=1 Tax=Canavalia gladiata TaxID=3824 RepID=A0AAN9LML1_CANGL
MPFWLGSSLLPLIVLFLEKYGLKSLEGITAMPFAWMFGEVRSDDMERLLGILVPKLNSRPLQQDVGVVDYFASGLLAIGQSSTSASTYVGQFIMRGFLNLRLKMGKGVNYPQICDRPNQGMCSCLLTLPDVKGVDNGLFQIRHYTRAYFVACGYPGDGD